MPARCLVKLPTSEKPEEFLIIQTAFSAARKKKQLICVPYSDVLLRAHPRTLLHSPACAWINMRQNDGMIVTPWALHAGWTLRSHWVRARRATNHVMRQATILHQVTKKVSAALITCAEQLCVWFVENAATFWINNAFNTCAIVFHVLTCWIRDEI